ncbi:MAG TPA: ThuA domain-containing protein [Flavobacteriia bacterium]|nr:ThuA domain-containing protein [Flavobacteriia bacterium]
MKSLSLLYRCYIVISILLLSNSYAQKLPKIIVFSKTQGYRHASIEDGIKSIATLGKENNFSVQATEDADELVSLLDSCKAVVFLSTTGDILNDAQQEKFKIFINNGGGFVGIHAAADTEYNWPWYGKMVGAYFESHPKRQQAKIKVVNHKHPATAFLGSEWLKFDEWYNYKEINPAIKVLMKLDESSYIGGKNGQNHPIAWYHKFDGGKVFYTGLGHTKASYQDATFLKHILGGIQYVISADKPD